MNIAIIFAGGKGTRMSLADKPKQFLEIDNKPILCYTIDHFQNSDLIDAIIVVINKDWLEHTKNILENYSKVVSIIPGGKTALDSQFIGLSEAEKFAKDGEHIVLIHDGVRPLINKKLIADCISSVKEKGNGITTAPATETIIRTNANGDVTEILDRAFCQYARAPQAFYLADILSAHRKSIKEEKHDFIDSATMMSYYGYTLHTVLGPYDNIKVTTDKDFFICKGLLPHLGEK